MLKCRSKSEVLNMCVECIIHIEHICHTHMTYVLKPYTFKLKELQCVWAEAWSCTLRNEAQGCVRNNEFLGAEPIKMASSFPV